MSRLALRPVGILRDERRTNPWLDVAFEFCGRFWSLRDGCESFDVRWLLFCWSYVFEPVLVVFFCSFVVVPGWLFEVELS